MINVTGLVFIFFISDTPGLQNWRSGGTADHFTFRVDSWTPDGESVVEHIAGIEDYQLALVTFRAACQRWPGAPITLRQGARVIEDSLTSARGLTKGQQRPWPMALPKAAAPLYMSAQSSHRPCVK